MGDAASVNETLVKVAGVKREVLPSRSQETFKGLPTAGAILRGLLCISHG